MSVVVVAVLVAVVAVLLRGGTRESAPRLSPDLPAALLIRAGFPVTDHNIASVRAELGHLFLVEAHAVSPALAARVTAAVADLPVDALWSQHVLDAVAEIDPDTAVRLAGRVPEILLATAGTGRGLLGGSIFEPLPTPVAGVATIVEVVPEQSAGLREFPVIPAPRRPVTLPAV